jgi:hypothetical protein
MISLGGARLGLGHASTGWIGQGLHIH